MNMHFFGIFENTSFNFFFFNFFFFGFLEETPFLGFILKNEYYIDILENIFFINVISWNFVKPFLKNTNSHELFGKVNFQWKIKILYSIQEKIIFFKGLCKKFSKMEKFHLFKKRILKSIYQIHSENHFERKSNDFLENNILKKILWFFGPCHHLTNEKQYF